MIVPYRFAFVLLGLSLASAGGLVLDSGTAAQEVPALKKAPSNPPEIIGADIVTRRAVCKWADKPPVLDGKLDDRCWQKGAVIDHFASFWTGTPRTGMFAYLVWDQDALYYAASMSDTELRSFGTKRNDTLWEGDVFELFFKPSATRPEYFEFQANPRMLVFEMAVSKRGVDPLAYTTSGIATRAGRSKAAFPGRRSPAAGANRAPETNGASRSAAMITVQKERGRFS